MKRIVCAGLIVGVFSSSGFAGEYRAKVVQVLAGDSVRVEYLGEAAPPNSRSKAKLSNVVRLRFSDAPEIPAGSSRPGQPFGNEAKEFMRRLLYVTYDL